ncbi:MAG: FtsQ-type POTRA domain-containing protein [Proteobacteria bacterium]|nr:FtsQ-type POTRA domain-containing protein [Pseudomonadota bacterium]
MPRLNVSSVRRAARRWRPSRRLVKGAAIIAAVGLAAAPAAYVWRAGLPPQVTAPLAAIPERAVAATMLLGFTVEEVLVEGRGETTAAEILAKLGVKRGAPILAFSPTAARAELERLPWVRSAAIERRLPDTIFVRVSERQPLALWQRHGRLALIDREGTEIKGVDIGRFAQLPIVVGDNAPKAAAALLDLLATEPDLEKRVAAAIHVNGRRWNVQLDNGIEIQLPEVNAGAAWARLAEIERDSRLLNRRVSNVDLRLPDRLIVRIIQGTPPAPPPKFKRPPARPT